MHSWRSDLLLSHGTAKSLIQLSTTFLFIMERDMKKNIYICIFIYTHAHTHIYMPESLHCIPKTNTILQIIYKVKKN